MGLDVTYTKPEEEAKDGVQVVAVQPVAIVDHLLTVGWGTLCNAAWVPARTCTPGLGMGRTGCGVTCNALLCRVVSLCGAY